MDTSPSELSSSIRTLGLLELEDFELGCDEEDSDGEEEEEEEEKEVDWLL